jgi:CBS domain-containing protein/ribosome-associated translation inhibitor RaiA
MPASWPTAADLMSPDVVSVAEDAPISHAIGLMRSRGFHELPVVRRRKYLGLLTFETIARRANLPLSTKVGHLLILPPVVNPSTSYADLAEQLLASGLRAAPVIDAKGVVTGIVSRTDLIREFPRLGTVGSALVASFQSPAAVVVRESDRCATLFAQIRAIEDHPLPVVDRRGRLVGAVGISDLGRVLWRPVTAGKKDAKAGRSIYDVEIGSLMRTPAVTIEGGASAADAARIMTREKVSSVFVVEGGRPAGVVSQADLLGLVVAAASKGPSRVEDVYVQITGLRGSSDPSVVSEIDRLVASGLRHISRQVQPTLLSLHFAPHANHRSGDATVEARLHTDRGIYYASHTGWNLLAGISTLMDELLTQIRRAREERQRRERRSPRTLPDTEESADADLESRLAAVASAPRRSRRRRHP